MAGHSRRSSGRQTFTLGLCQVCPSSRPNLCPQDGSPQNLIGTNLLRFVFRQKPLHIAPANQQYGLIILLLTETERHLSDTLEQLG
jgi:hypothetical protein